MKSLICLTMVCSAAVSYAQMPSPASKAPIKIKELSVPENVDSDLVKEAGNKAIKAVLADFLRQHDVPMKRYAILPLQQDVEGGYLTNQLRNYFSTLGSGNGYELYTRMDDEFRMLLNEIAWGQSYGDTMDPATVQKFGRIQGVQGLITGRVSGLSKAGGDDVKLRFSMQVFEVETGKLVWGEEKVAYGKRSAEGGFFSYWDADKTKWALIAGGGIVALLIVLRVVKAIGVAARPR